MLIQEERPGMTSSKKIVRKQDMNCSSDFHLNSTMLGDDNTLLGALNSSRSNNQIDDKFNKTLLLTSSKKSRNLDH